MKVKIIITAAAITTGVSVTHLHLPTDYLKWRNGKEYKINVSLASHTHPYCISVLSVSEVQMELIRSVMVVVVVA